MVVVLTLAFFLSAVLTIYVMFRSGNTRVPDVVGKSEAEAKAIMESGKFEIKIQRRADEAPINTVIETRPAPRSSVKTNSLVTIVISSGPVQNKSQLDRQRFHFPASALPIRFEPAALSLNRQSPIMTSSANLQLVNRN